MTARIPPFTPNAAPPARPEQPGVPAGNLLPFGDVLRAILLPGQAEASEAAHPVPAEPAAWGLPATAQSFLPEPRSGFAQDLPAALAAAPEASLEGRELRSAAEVSTGYEAGASNQPPAARPLRAFSDVRLGADATRSGLSGMDGAADKVSEPFTARNRVIAAPGASLDADWLGPPPPDRPDDALAVRGPAGTSLPLTVPGSGDLVAGPPASPPLRARPNTPGSMALISSAHGRNGSGPSPSTSPSGAARYPALPPLSRQELSASSAVQVSVLPAGAGLDVRLRLGPLPEGGASRLRDEVSAILASHGLRIGKIAVFAPTFPQSLKEET